MKKISICVAGLIILSTVLVTMPIEEDSTSLSSQLNTENEISNEFPLLNRSNTAWVMDYESDKLASVSGTHYEMGYQHGAMLPDETKQTMRGYLDYVPETVEELLEVYEKGEPYISDEYKWEMEGLSDSTGVSLDEIQAVHSIPTLYHCSGFGVSGEATATGKVYHTRSLDYGVDIADPETGITLQMNSVTLFRHPNHGYGHVVPAWAGFLGGVDGMNEAKISIGEMGQSTSDWTQEGNFMIFRLRDTLEKAGNMEEAISYMEPNRTYGFSFVVADGESNTSQMIEMSHNHYYNGSWDHVQEANGYNHFQMPNAVRRGNHYMAYQTALTQRDDYMVMPTDGRFMHLLNYLEHSKRLEREYGNIDFDMAQDIFVEAYRRYPFQMTLHQIVFSPSDLRIRRANAYPEGTGAFWNEFNEYSFPMVENQPDLLTLANPLNGSVVSGEVEVIPEYEYTPTSMELYINGVKINEVDSAPFEFTWDSSNVSSGNHVVEVRAYGENYSAIAYNTVTVNGGTNVGGEQFEIVHENVRVEKGDTPIKRGDIIQNFRIPSVVMDNTYSSDDWIINETVYLNHTTEEVAGNVTIQDGGSLIMDNSTLRINSTFDLQYGLKVTGGGSLIVRNSTITNGDYDIYCQADGNADEIKIIDSKVEGGGDTIYHPLFSVTTPNAVVKGSTFVHSGFGFVAMGGIDNITVKDSNFILKDPAHRPMEDIFSPRGASILMSNVEQSVIENVTIEGIDNGRLLSFGIMLVSQGVTVRDVYVEHEFGGIGLMGSQNNELNNITVRNSHAGVITLLNSRHNLVENLKVEHGAIGFGSIFDSPHNTFRDVYVNDTTLAFAAEDSDGMKVENAEIDNAVGGALLSGSSYLEIINTTIEVDYAGLIFGSGCHQSIAKNVSLELTRDLFGVGIERSDNLVLHDITVQGARYALDVQGNAKSHFDLDISNFQTDTGEVKYYADSVPDTVIGDQVILHNISDTVVEVETGDAPVYLSYASNVTLNASVNDAVNGILVVHSYDVTVEGKVVNSSTHGVKIEYSQDVDVNVDVDGACWAYSIQNSQGVDLKGEATNIKDAAVYAHTSTDTHIDIESSESVYGLIAGHSVLYISGNIPPHSYEPKTHQATIYMLHNVELNTDAETDGWNFVSFNLEPDITDLGSILEHEEYGISGNYDRVMYYDASVDEWLTYVPGRAEHFNNLQTWDHTMGLWIRMTEDDTLTIEGVVPESTEITLYPGWNMVGYPSGANRVASDVLPEEVTKIGVFNRYAPYNIEYIYDLSTVLLVQGRAYWVYNGAQENVLWEVEYG